MSQRLRLGEILVRAGVLTDEQVQQALDSQSGAPGRKERLGGVIARLGLATESEIATAVAQQTGIPFIDLARASPDPAILELIPRRLAEHHQIVPVDRTGDGTLVVAVADPTNVVAIDDVRMRAGDRKVRLAVATASAIGEAIERWYGIGSELADTVMQMNAPIEIEVLPQAQGEQDEEALQRSVEKAPIVRLVNALITDAVRSRATDIHVEPYATDLRVRFRVDGLLREVMTLPKYVQLPVTSRIKIMSGMDISERRRPQDGRSRLRVAGEEVDMRVSTMPTLNGEKTVVRLLRKGEDLLDYDALGMGEEDLATMERLLSMPQGLVIFTGPTGSGKTTSMYAAIRRLLDPTKNIVTLEDPIEYQVPGVNQVQIDERTGVTFARGLRSILRQDPNVILVGEIRDGETAQISLQAAFTGHLVLSTLHTNDAPAALSRLVDLGVEPFLISSALSAVIAQRLLRRVCPHCTERSNPSERTLALLGMTRTDLVGKTVVQGAGCEECGYTGYRGQIGIFEILEMSRQIREQVAAQASEGTITQMARAEGMRTLRQSALELAFAGETTLEEVLRATYFEREETLRCPGCRQEVDRTFATCPYCQSDLSGRACSGCGLPARSEWSTCPRCGTELAASPLNQGMPRILVIDDDEDLSGMLTALLAPSYQVTKAGTGAEGLRKATLERPDVILLDQGLPDMLGTEVATRLRAHVGTSAIPIVMLTGTEERETEVVALQAGIDDFIRKPLEEDVLEARIAAVLRRTLRR